MQEHFLDTFARKHRDKVVTLAAICYLPALAGWLYFIWVAQAHAPLWIVAIIVTPQLMVLLGVAALIERLKESERS